MLDKKAFRSMSYGVYIVSSTTEYMAAGCVVNTPVQVTSSPARISVAVNNDNATAAVIRTAGKFSVVALSKDVDMGLIGTFGFKTSYEHKKFEQCAHAVDIQGLPYPTEGIVARFSVKVEQALDLGSHTLFVGEVVESESYGGEPMTYAYYHQVKGGKTPAKASSFSTDALEQDQTSQVAPAKEAGAKRVGWRCRMCGYTEWVDELPAGFTCPWCGRGAEFFDRVEE